MSMSDSVSCHCRMCSYILTQGKVIRFDPQSEKPQSSCFVRNDIHEER